MSRNSYKRPMDKWGFFRRIYFSRTSPMRYCEYCHRSKANNRDLCVILGKFREI